MRQGTGIKQGELMAKISLAHVFPLFNKYFLRARSMPGTVLVTWDISMNKKDKILVLLWDFPYQKRQSIIDPISGLFNILQ